MELVYKIQHNQFVKLKDLLKFCIIHKQLVAYIFKNSININIYRYLIKIPLAIIVTSQKIEKLSNQISSQNKGEVIMEHDVDVPIKNGQGTWYKEIKHGEKIEGDLEILSPDEGKWDITFYDEDNPHGTSGRFEWKKEVAAHHLIHVDKHTMEKKFFVIDFKWSEHRDATLKIKAKYEH